MARSQFSEGRKDYTLLERLESYSSNTRKELKLGDIRQAVTDHNIKFLSVVVL